ncbi:MAG: YtxH domain-containing protein [Actinomycetota bacterium]|jgi:gas vesicle protein|nr:YtxH domain-containing protein [Actinomycetota bacterium]
MSEQAPRRQREVLDRQRLRSFLLGGAAGVIAGILLAPRSGRELRGSIRERAGEARERSRESLFEAQERMQERLSEVREGSGRPDPASQPPEAAPVPRAHLRDVSRDEGEPAERSEELRRKVRETRERLSENLDRPRGEGRDLRPGP